jgi:lauroyl/myristoyl acyltransferase
MPRLAQLTGVPVIPFYTLHDNRYVIVRFLPPLKEVSPLGLEAMMMQAINESPSLWFWWRRLGKIKRGERRH